MNTLFALLGLCPHRHCTFPQSPRGAVPTKHNTHVTCLGCGKRFGYDPQAFRRGAELRETGGAAEEVVA